MQRICGAVILFACSSFLWARTPSFQGLGTLDGGYSVADAVSGDGSTVVGYSTGPTGTEAFVWHPGLGMEGLGDLPGGSFVSSARGVNYDGTVIVGTGTTEDGTEAMRWTRDTGMVSLGFRGAAADVSDDGSVIVGTAGFAFRWTAGGATDLGTIGDCDTREAFGVSADGSAVTGYGLTGHGSRAFCWSASGDDTRLPDLPGGSFGGYAKDVSADGVVVVGGADRTSDGEREAFLWTQAGGIVPLGRLPGDDNSDARGVSADGTVIVGLSHASLGIPKAFIWDEENGMRNLQVVLEDEYGLDLTGWSLREAHGVSDDGMVIVGLGTNPAGETEAFVAVLPEPATIGMLALGSLALVRRKRKR